MKTELKTTAGCDTIKLQQSKAMALREVKATPLHHMPEYWKNEHTFALCTHSDQQATASAIHTHLYTHL
jgi:hypothetical protein